MNLFDLKDLEKLERELKQMQQNAREIEGTHTVNFGELFNIEFMEKYTNSSSISEFLNASGLDFSSQESFKNINETELDVYISKNSSFSSWSEMKSKAGQIWAAKKMNN